MLILIVTIFLVLFCNGFTVNYGPTTKDGCINNTTGVCLTAGCVTSDELPQGLGDPEVINVIDQTLNKHAARMIGAMDISVNPCDDFYQFACGTWMKKNVIPQDKKSVGTLTRLADDTSMIVKYVLENPNRANDPDVVLKAKNYYKACMNEGKIEEHGLTFIQQHLDEFGGWPILGTNTGGNWNSSTYNLEDLLVRIRKQSNHIPLVDIGVITDEKNPRKHVLYIDQPDFGMPSRDYYLSSRDDVTVMAYQTMIRDIAVALGADPVTATNDAKFIVDMEIQLTNITVPLAERRNRVQMYNKMTLGELNGNFTGVDWWRVFQETFQHIGLSLNQSEPVVVRTPSFLENIGTLIARYSPRVIVNYILSRRVLEKIVYLPKTIRNIRLKYWQVLYGSVTESPRWQICSNHVKYRLPEIVGRLFVEEAFTNESKKEVLDMVSRLRAAFKGIVNNLSWMENATQQIAREKVDFMESKMGYSDIIYNNSVLHKLYVNYRVYVDDPMRTLVSVDQASVIKQLSNLRQDVDKHRWYMSPATVNAYYERETNQITFPAAILQPPLYSIDQPAYLNYGGIGYVIGHEITHGFDDQGRLYDKTGALNNWWSEKNAANFNARVQCIIDQYNNFTIHTTGNLSTSGAKAQGENIADNGGIKQSYYAYREWVRTSRKGEEEKSLPGMNYTPNQLFFLNSAQLWCEKIRDKAMFDSLLTDSHAVSMFRVYGPLQNFVEFSQAWNCPVGSFMNPPTKCSIW